MPIQFPLKVALKEYEQALEILNSDEIVDKILLNSFENVSNFMLNGRNVSVSLIKF